MRGFWVSLTVTRNEQLLVSPAASVALKTKVLMPFGKICPDAGPAVCCTALVGKAQLSVTLGSAKEKTAWQRPGLVPTAWLGGQTIPGACESVTPTVKVQVAVRPAPSVAFHCTVVTPIGKLLPLAVFEKNAVGVYAQHLADDVQAVFQPKGMLIGLHPVRAGVLGHMRDVLININGKGRFRHVVVVHPVAADSLFARPLAYVFVHFG